MDQLNINQSENAAFSHNFTKMIGDMNFVGLMYIIFGALSCLSIIGAITGIPILISGLRLREASEKFDVFKTSNDQRMLEDAFERQGRFFFIQKVLMIIGLVVMGLVFVIYAIALIALVSRSGSY